VEDHRDANSGRDPGTFQITPERVPSPDLTVVPAENFFREAELNFTNVQLIPSQPNDYTLRL
jgi:hypothetical protein